MLNMNYGWMELAIDEEKALDGNCGEGLATEYRVLVAIGKTTVAKKLVPAKWAHISGVNYDSIGDGQPINFLAVVNANTGTITDPLHELYGKSLKGSVLILPYATGSSVDAYAIYSLKEYGNAPSALVCSKADITTASDCALANIRLSTCPME
jgi:predicted aconitase with swiveling domain